MALVKTWDELKAREGSDAGSAIAVYATEIIAKAAKDSIEGADQLPHEVDARILDAVAKAGSGAFNRAYDRALAAAMRVVIDMVADYEAECARAAALRRLGKT